MEYYNEEIDKTHNEYWASRIREAELNKIARELANMKPYQYPCGQCHKPDCGYCYVPPPPIECYDGDHLSFFLINEKN